MNAKILNCGICVRAMLDTSTLCSENGAETRKNKKKTGLFLTIMVFLVVFLCSCAGRAKPEDTIYRLEKAFNDYDIEEMMKCYEPSVQKMFEGIMKVAGSLAGDMDLMEIISGLGGLAGVLDSNSSSMDLTKMEITINSMEEVDEDKVLADITMKFIYGSEFREIIKEDTSQEQRMKLYLIYLDDAWYISAEVPDMF